MIMAVLTNNLTRSQNQNRLRAFISQRTRVGASIKSAMMYGVKSTDVVKVYLISERQSKGISANAKSTILTASGLVSRYAVLLLASTAIESPAVSIANSLNRHNVEYANGVNVCSCHTLSGNIYEQYPSTIIPTKKATSATRATFFRQSPDTSLPT